MKQLFVIILVLYLMSLDAAYSATRTGFGAGVMLGSPTGLSFQNRRETDQFDFGLSWDFDEEFTAIADYKVRSSDFISRAIGRSAPNFSAYAGMGLYVDYDNYHHRHHHHHHDDWEFGIRVPVGIDYMFANVPVGVFLELAPTLQLIDEVDLGMMGALGARYYF